MADETAPEPFRGDCENIDHRAEATPNDDRFLRLRQVAEMTGQSRSTIYRKMAEGSFPRPKVLGPNSVAWRLSEVTAWMDRLPTVHPYAGSSARGA